MKSPDRDKAQAGRQPIDVASGHEGRDDRQRERDRRHDGGQRRGKNKPADPKGAAGKGG